MQEEAMHCEVYATQSTTPALMPFIASYRASSLSLMDAETKKIKLLGIAFGQFQEAIDRYAAVSYLPEFLRGSVAENLPWFFLFKRRSARNDFQSIIEKQAAQPEYAGAKIMNFTYRARAKQHQSKRSRAKALRYLDKVIQPDPEGQAARMKAETLKQDLAGKD